MRLSYLVALSALSISAQKIGDVPEVHPIFSTHRCTDQGCIEKKTKLVIDATWRDLLDIKTGVSCLTDDLRLNKTFCPTEQECAKNCALQGAHYPRTGVESKDDGTVRLDMYRKYEDELIAVGPQLYLLGPKENDYQILHLLNQEISFDIDVSSAPCGIDTAVFLTSMSPSGGRSSLNRAGAAYGTGYCDSQCYTSYAFIDGVANIDHKGTCCNEMDLWEGNKHAAQFTAHPCKITTPGVYGCSGKECGDGRQSVCDSDGCGFNPYGLGKEQFYGVDAKIDTKKPFRVVTQFITDDDTADGILVDIRRHYIQHGQTIPNANITLRNNQFDSLSTSFCEATNANSFLKHGGLYNMGEALKTGMVLTMGIWEIGSPNWLDSSSEGAGPCSRNEGKPSQIKKNHPDTSVTISNLRWGDIGYTCR